MAHTDNKIDEQISTEPRLKKIINSNKIKEKMKAFGQKKV